MLQSKNASDLRLEELVEARRILDAYPIEVAELRASPKQRAFQEAFEQRFDPDTLRALHVFVAMGGNRSGKSIVCGWLCMAKHLRDRARDGDWYWCVSQNLDRSIGGCQKELWKALPRWMFGEQRWDEKLGFGTHRKVVLRTRDGGKCLVEFRSADQDGPTFEQAKLDGVWADERIPEEIFDRLLPRLLDKNGWILYSDIPEQWWQFERLKEAQDPAAGVYFVHFLMTDNAHNLPAGAIQRAMAIMTEDEKKLRIYGEFVVMEGVVYKEYSDRVHLHDGFEIPAAWPKWRLIDYGASAPTACAWIALAPNERAYVYREYYAANQSVAVNAAAILAASGDEQYVCTYIDPHAYDPPPVFYSASKTIAEQYAEAGVENIVGWPFINVMGEHALVQRVKKRLETVMLRVFAWCTNCRREFRSWKYKTDREGKPLAVDQFENGNNHLLDCIKGFFATNPCFTQLGVVVTSPGGAVVAGDGTEDEDAGE